MSKKTKKVNMVDKMKDTFSFYAADPKGFSPGNKAKSNIHISKPSALSRIKSFFSLSDGITAQVSTVPETSWRSEWPKEMSDYQDVYKKVSIVRQCINLKSSFAVSIGWHIKTEHEDLKKYIEDMQARTNFPEMLKKAVKMRDIWGGVGFEKVRDKNGHIVDFVILHPQKLQVHINVDTMQIDHFKYNRSGKIIELPVEDVFYLTKDALGPDKRGVSTLESIKTTVNRKWNLEKDLEQAAKRLWAPFTLFKYDSSYTQDRAQQQKEIRAFIDKIKPGRTIVHNQKVEPQIINMTPDISSLNEAIESADQEIIGNWGIPKALLSREKSVSQATLEFSIRSMYESSVASTQQYLKFEIENQIYDEIAEMLGYEANSVYHVWNVAKFHDAPVIRSLLYGVKEGVLSPAAMVEMLGWDVEIMESRPDDEVKPRDKLPVEDRPVTMQEIEFLLDEKLNIEEK